MSKVSGPSTAANAYPVVRLDLNQCDWTVVEPDYFCQPKVGDLIIIRDWDDREPYRALCVVTFAEPAPYGPGLSIKFKPVREWSDD